MTNKDELLETVAKALHASDPLARGYRGDWQSYKPIAQVAIDTIRAAARPAQEPVAWRWRYDSPSETLGWFYDENKPNVGDDVIVQPLFSLTGDDGK